MDAVATGGVPFTEGVHPMRITAALVLAVTAQLAWAVPPDGAPTGTTARCGDGTYSFSVDKRGACRGHRGVKEWFGSPVAAPPSEGPASSAGHAAPVWVNTVTKVYHCKDDEHYGKTKSGRYMSEAEARQMGFHSNQNKTCP